MKKHKLFFLIVFSFFTCVIISACKKDIQSDAYPNSNTVLRDLKIPGTQLLKKPDGSGYMIVYSSKDNYGRDQIGVAVTDNNCNTLSNNIISSIKCTNGFYHCFDDKGNLYICGNTNKASLKMDKGIYDPDDAYIAKVDPTGKLIWERGYCDTTNGRKGAALDEFYEVYFINNKIYCAGATGNYQTPQANNLQNYDIWMVVFDLDGNTIKQKVMPGVYLNNNDILNAGGANWEDAIKTENNDLVFRMCYSKNGTDAPFTSDTLICISRFNTQTDSVSWAKYFRRGSAQEDLSNFGELPNGNIACFDSYYNTYSILDGNTGNVVSVNSTGFINTGTGTAYNSYNIPWGLWSFALDDGLYIPGNYSQGANYKNPWLLKLDHNGNIAFTKTYNITNAGFNSLTQNKSGNIQLIGNVFKSGTREVMDFVLSTDKNGIIIKP